MKLSELMYLIAPSQRVHVIFEQRDPEMDDIVFEGKWCECPHVGSEVYDIHSKKDSSSHSNGTALAIRCVLKSK